MSARWALIAALCLCACAPKAAEVENPSAYDVDDPNARAPAGQPSGARVASIEPAALVAVWRKRSLRVSRSELDSVLDQGPARLLRGVEVKPRFRDRRFVGWQIVQFMHGEARFDELDLMANDIIGTVNDTQIVRPEHLATLWTELRTASSIVIQVTRQDESFVLRFDVHEDAKPLAP